MRVRSVLAALAAAVVLGACGGDDDDDAREGGSPINEGQRPSPGELPPQDTPRNE